MKNNKINEVTTTEARESFNDPPSFLNRWSQRKLQAKEPNIPSQKIEKSTTPDHELTDADMPPLESLDERSDYSGFLSAKVSPELRRLALRKLFHSPAFHHRDGLDDFDEDFTRFAKLGNVITQEMKHRLEVEAKRVAQNIKDQNPEAYTETDPSPQTADFSSSDPNRSAEMAEQKPSRT